MHAVGFFRCECGKMHVTHGIGSATVCSCGRKLADQMLKALEKLARVR